jgi:hypothetical protein
LQHPQQQLNEWVLEDGERANGRTMSRKPCRRARWRLASWRMGGVT